MSMFPDPIFYLVATWVVTYFVVKAVRTGEIYAWMGALFFLALTGARAIRASGGHEEFDWILDAVVIVSGFSFGILGRRAIRKTSRTP